MEKNKRKRKRGQVTKAVLIAIILVVILVVFGLFVLPQILYYMNGDEETKSENGLSVSDQVTESDESDEATASIEPIKFPVLIEDGKIEITNVFLFDGINPDCQKADGKDIVAISLKNLSDSYLDTANVSVTLSDGTECSFVIHDLPPEESVMAFSVENLSLPAGYVCTDVYGECRFDQTKKDSRIEVSVNAASITLTNVTDKDLINVVVYCHDIFDDKYFGGIAYMYTVDRLSAGESTTIMASDSLMGMIDVVRIAVDN